MKGTINISTSLAPTLVPQAGLAAIQPTTCTPSLRITSPPGDDDSTTLVP